MLRLGVGGIVLVDEAHWAAEYDLGDVVAEMGLDPALQIGEIESENGRERHGLLADIGLLVDQRGAENALQRAHEAAVMTPEIKVDRVTPIVNGMVLEIEEHRARQRQMILLERQQMGLRMIADADGRVRGSEIDSAEGRNHARLTSSPFEPARLAVQERDVTCEIRASF